MKFIGTSSTGIIEDALLDAFQKAKQKLETDHIVWTLEQVSGEYGGYVVVNIVNVEIEAKVP